jgi:hypothetical protein
MASASGVAGAGGAGDALARAHAHMLADHALQFTFVAFKPPEIPAWLKWLGRLLADIAPAMQWVFWLGLAVAVLAVLVFVAREIIAVRWPGFLKSRPAVLAAPEWRPEPARARALLEDADRLAAQGLFAEAAHLLLHRSIDDLQGRRPTAVRPALTARDIARLDTLPAAARAPFQLIAEVVERSFFGGRPVDAAGFADCRKAYESFALPEAWG